jgi:hypothetical protein
VVLAAGFVAVFLVDRHRPAGRPGQVQAIRAAQRPARAARKGILHRLAVHR